jgi:peroxiredoxin
MEPRIRRPSMKPLQYAVAAILAAAVAAGAYLGMGRPAAAPAVAYTLLDGSASDIGQLRGKVVLVNFWATSCTTCVQEMPQIAATYDRYKARGYDTLAIAMSYDTPAYVAQFAHTRQLPFAVAFDRDGTLARSFGDVQLTPTSVLINKRGEIVKRYVGAPDFAALQRLIEKLLAET